ncbi:MAG: RluA family pseudouridine synthase [Neisseriaceae bacterium]|nr:MAG: RluA family pseudouridine synthase [Neisseriaceae bacterium]
MSQISKVKVNFLSITSEESGQRIDNYLQKHLKGVPKSHIHKIIRSGEVRINKQRIKSNYKIQENDSIRIPPVKITHNPLEKSIPLVPLPIIYEDDALLVINKPSGIASHGGSGLSFGVIEQLRKQRPEAKYLELVHRLDKDTSGLLMVAKKRKILIKLHEQFRQNHPKKIYLALSINRWDPKIKDIKLPLIKYQGEKGEKMVRVDTNGQYAHSQFKIVENFSNNSLLEVTLKTGRTHQIRVHMQSENSPIAGDERYGNYALNKQLQKQGLKRMFLHALQLKIKHPDEAHELTLEAPIPKDLGDFLCILRNK